MTSKQRAYLMSLASNLNPIFQVGKSSLTPELTAAIGESFNNNELIDYCFSRDIAVEVWSPLGGTGGNLLQDETLVRLAQKYGRTPAQIVLRWGIQRNVVVIPKSTHRERIVSNQSIFDFEVSDQDMEAVTRLNREARVGADPEHFNF